ncbi:hypothetical protein MY3296_002426 [Beauveria thailandica]
MSDERNAQPASRWVCSPCVYATAAPVFISASTSRNLSPVLQTVSQANHTSFGQPFSATPKGSVVRLAGRKVLAWRRGDNKTLARDERRRIREPHADNAGPQAHESPAEAPLTLLPSVACTFDDTRSALARACEIMKLQDDFEIASCIVASLVVLNYRANMVNIDPFMNVLIFAVGNYTTNSFPALTLEFQDANSGCGGVP